MVDYSKIQGIQISSELLMYGVVVVAAQRIDDNSEISVLTIADGGASDQWKYPISDEQFKNLTSSIVTILHDLKLDSESEDDNGYLTCNALIQDIYDSIEEYICPKSLDVDTYKQLLQIFNNVVNCEAIDDLLGWI